MVKIVSPPFAPLVVVLAVSETRLALERADSGVGRSGTGISRLQVLKWVRCREILIPHHSLAHERASCSLRNIKVSPALFG